MNAPSELGLVALGYAIDEMRRKAGEQGANNHGPDIKLYAGSEGVLWCAAFVSWCFEQAAQQLGRALPFNRSLSARTLGRRIARAGRKVSVPRPGDIFVKSRGARNSRKGHIGIIWLTNELPRFTAIEGNVGRFPSPVQALTHVVDEGGLLYFARAP